MKTIIIYRNTKQIIETRDYSQFNYAKVLDEYEEIDYDYDFILGEKPIYYIDGKLAVIEGEEPIPSTLNPVII